MMGGAMSAPGGLNPFDQELLNLGSKGSHTILLLPLFFVGIYFISLSIKKFFDLIYI